MELKYKTRKLLVGFDGDEYRLATHSARDIGRYDFIKDIYRLERIAVHMQNCEGWAILLTNDSPYWKPSSGKGTVDEAFRIGEGRVLHGSLGWTENASDGTKRNREANVEIQRQYALSWRDYSEPTEGSYGRFRYLAVHVPRRV